MDHESWLPWTARQLVADFRGVKPHDAQLCVGVSWYAMDWQRPNINAPWRFRERCVQETEFHSSRAVWPGRSPVWVYPGRRA